jgi:serine/threonine-protein kinase
MDAAARVPTATSGAGDDERLPSAGDVLGGRYVVQEVIGRGAASVVVTALHPELRQVVAIKILRGDPSADGAERLVREARAALAIQSEHIVRVMDVLSHDGRPCLVMERLVGRDLRSVMHDRGALPVDEAVDVLLQVCDAVAEAHARGIVHRDLKLANLFLTTRIDGSPLVKVLDFGIAKTLAPLGDELELSLTDTAAILGSPLYMSPEQVRSSKHLDHRSDIWSIGVILYRLLTNAAPFEGETFSSVCAAIIADDPVSLRARRPEVPEGLARVVERCMKKEAVWRPASVAELAAALEPFASTRGRASVQRLLRARPVDATAPATPSAARDADAKLESTVGTLDGTAPAALVPARSSRGGGRARWSVAGGLVVVGVVAGAVWLARDRPSSTAPIGPTVVAASIPSSASTPTSVAPTLLPPPASVTAPASSVSAAPSTSNASAHAMAAHASPPTHAAAATSASTPTGEFNDRALTERR